MMRVPRRDKEERDREECMGKGYSELGFFEYQQRRLATSASMRSQQGVD